MARRLTCLLAVMLFFGPLLRAQSDGCMGVPIFSDWTKTKSHPYRPASDRAKGIQRGYKVLKLGMKLEQARSLIPQPDWAEDGWKGCTWHYATSLASDGWGVRSVTVRFGGDVVNGLGKEDVSVSQHPRSLQD